MMPKHFLFTKKTIGFAMMSALLMHASCHKEIKEAQVAASGDDSPALMAQKIKTNTNIILLLADDVGYEVPAYTGGKSYSTPNMDYLAANGAFFQHAYSHPDGYPSRLALFTGKYNFRNYTYWGHFPPGAKSFSNMLHDAGYKTCYVGRWVMGGGDQGIHAQGYDSYSCFQANVGDDKSVGRYKNPIIFQDGAFLPSSETEGKYSEDFFSDYLCNFIDANKNKPFYATYAFNEAAAPYVPTPDDPEFASWNTKNETRHDDAKYYPSMINYMDKMIGKVMAKLRADGLEKNTVIMWVADNATQQRITSVWGANNIEISGQKTETNIWGTLAPLVAYCPGKISPKRDNETLIDYTDFLPTFADIAGIPKPTTYGTLDGVTFYDNLMNKGGKDRKWVFCHWDGTINDAKPRVRFVNNINYKLYDTLNYSQFYNIVNDTFETSPIPDNQLTPKEKTIKKQFIKVLQSEHN